MWWGLGFRCVRVKLVELVELVVGDIHSAMIIRR